MNSMERSLRELQQMDDLQRGSSPIHSLAPLPKFLTTLVFLAVTMSFSKYDLTGLLPMLIYPALLFSLSGVRVRTCFRKLRIVLPLVLAVGIMNPFFDRDVLFRLGRIPVTGGVISMLTLMLKGVLCLTASFLLMATTSIDRLCGALRQIHVPAFLVTLLLLTYRYVGVMTEELAVMTDAYHLRAPGQKGIHHSAWGSFLGQLLLRSMDRAEELYSSMQLRGYHEHFHYADIKPCTVRDGIYTICCVGLFLLLRLVNVAQLLGSLFVR